MRTLWTALVGVGLLVGCNTAAGVKEDSRQAADYTYDKKEEYQRKLAAEMKELDVKIDELKAKAGRASDSVKAEFAKDMEALDRQKGVLAQKMEAVKTSSASGWNDVKAGANSAMDSVKQTYEKAKAKLP
ncbi:MAG TPA: coiled coil domain-containing protein [Methylomirabilota bacterium]